MCLFCCCYCMQTCICLIYCAHVSYAYAFKLINVHVYVCASPLPQSLDGALRGIIRLLDTCFVASAHPLSLSISRTELTELIENLTLCLMRSVFSYARHYGAFIWYMTSTSTDNKANNCALYARKYGLIASNWDGIMMCDNCQRRIWTFTHHVSDIFTLPLDRSATSFRCRPCYPNTISTLSYIYKGLEPQRNIASNCLMTT